MAVWTFVEFVERSGATPFSDWVLSLPDDAQAHIAARLLQMEALPQWPEKWASRYKGYTSLVELRMQWNRRQYRPLGVYARGQRGTFVLLAGAIEKGGKLPKGDLESADRRRKELLREPTRVQPYCY